MENKQCSKCDQIKSTSEFSKRSDSQGYVSACKECKRKRRMDSSAKRSASNEGKYESQRKNAYHRGISFSLTFEQWLEIWINSGKLEERGRGANKYCMSRYGDTGAYEVGNVFIQLGRINVSEGNTGKVTSDETRAKMSAANSGKPHPWSEGGNNPMHRPEVKSKISEATSGEKHYNQRGVNTPQGYFVTAKAAHQALGISQSTIEWRARNNKFGFSYGDKGTK